MKVTVTKNQLFIDKVGIVFAYQDRKSTIIYIWHTLGNASAAN